MKNRRQFLLDGAAAACGGLSIAYGVSLRAGQQGEAQAVPAGNSLRPVWRKGRRLFTQVNAQGQPLLAEANLPLLDAFCCLGENESGQKLSLGDGQVEGAIGPIKAVLTHVLHDSGSGLGEDLLEARLRLLNTSDRPQQVCGGFVTFAQPPGDSTGRRAYLPLTAHGLVHGFSALSSLGGPQEQDPDLPVGSNPFAACYLEPMASDPSLRHARAMLLAPVIDIYHPSSPWRISMMSPSDLPRCFSTTKADSGADGWSARRCQTLAAGESIEERCFLMIHQGEADTAWRAFHRFAHAEDYPPIGWISEMRVHYYDFLSAADPQGRRGGGYDADLEFFRKFQVGLGTQHGYYPFWGDYIHPDRHSWKAMQGDKKGPAEMSLEKIKERIAATRRQGAKAAVYLHLCGLDDASPSFAKLRDAVLRDESGKPKANYWNGPDTVGKAWYMSIAAPEWRESLLQQAQWIMEILQPDAIVMDETFSGLGYDEHPYRRGSLSPYAIPFFRQLRKLVRSFGNDRAILTSDCSLAPFVLWADGEAGDHAYNHFLGNQLYRKQPVRYLAALGNKPWRPCAWHFQQFWNAQMELARMTGAGIGVSNGWLEYTGLARLSAETAKKLQTDIASLFPAAPEQAQNS